MNRLNGWQRIWVVLFAIWTPLVALVAYANLPTYVYHSIDYTQEPNLAVMSPAVRARMRTASWAGEDCGGPLKLATVVEEVKDLPGMSRPVALCFAMKGASDAEGEYFEPKLGRNAVERIKSEYARAYDAELRSNQLEQLPMFLAIWTIPGMVLYAFGWGIGWIRRGFRGTSE